MRTRPVAIAIAIVVLIGAALWYMSRRGAEEPTEVAEREAPPPLPAPAEPAPEAPPLPDLEASDELARELAGSLGILPPFTAALTDGEVLRRFVRVVDAIASGESPEGELPFLDPGSPFEATERDGRWFVDPAGYARYDFVANGFEALDVAAALMAYERLEPLLDRAYSESVGETRPFRPVFQAALTVLIDTPEPGAAPELVDAVNRFVYRDESLESLALAQKHLLRMGPDNQARIEATLRAIAVGLRTS